MPIIPAVPRRLHVSRLFVGLVPLDQIQARHARDVLRLAEGTEVEVFDDAGTTAVGTLVYSAAANIAVNVERVSQPQATPAIRLIVASAVPKGERADWMVEKLSELGVAAFIPLATERSVVLPTGTSKHDRWTRIATESAKQSKRPGVMRIEKLTPIHELLLRNVNGIVLSTAPEARPIVQAITAISPGEFHLFIGPEGGWTEAELQAFDTAKITPARLTATTLRTETAALAAVAVASLMVDWDTQFRL